MPNQETNVRTLKINRLTDAQYDAAIKNDAELYLTPDDDNSLSRNIGETVFSLIPLTDASLHLTDGALIDGNGIYSAFYNYMLNLYGDGTNPPNYFTDETSWQSSVTTYGVCGKFVIDTTNQTIRLPKITGIVEGTLDVNALGNLVEAGLPNIKGYVNLQGRANATEGAFSRTGISNARQDTDGNVRYDSTQIDIDASRSSSVYKDDETTVQPQTIKGYYYIVLATTTKTEIEIDIDEVTTEINNLSRAYIVETYSNGTDWYRVWSDGWCEQGGFKTSTGFITFLVPFTDNNFNFVFNRHYNSKTAAQTSDTNSANRNTVATSTQYGSTDGTGVYIGVATENGCDGHKWIACGYKA